MKATQFNLFKSAHRGLRALFADTLIQLQKTDFSIAEEAAAAIERVRVVLQQVQAHSKWENDFIFPALGKECLSMTDYFTSQHYHNDTLTLSLDILICEFEEMKADAQKESAANNILCAFIEFIAYNFKHMNMEDQLINPLLWIKYTDTELEILKTYSNEH
ncbi:hemerythrin domain-containing protein [Pedobacter nyackensis]|uniref:hemerythrin domain-containing protein n=1 Tax=Pedobacter nyackensis TaxID=475255 RepID=UPI0029305C6D|nr:hemerythrin domain-containing protein [Pedobacter nyackensis]